MRLIGNKKSPNVLVIGCFHGDEPQGKFLIEKYMTMVDSTNLLFIPCLNEYGFNHNTRTNENQIDLNRNFPTLNWEQTEKNEFYGGNKPASEVETQFVIETVEKYAPSVILTLHAPYKVVNYDGGCKNSEFSTKLIKRIAEIINYPIEPSIGYPTPGSFGTWAGVERDILTITLELDEEIEIKALEKPVFEIFKLLEELECKTLKN